jgi:hypothetical protein
MGENLPNRVTLLLAANQLDLARKCQPQKLKIWDRCYNFKNIFAKNGPKIGTFDSKQS